VKKVKEARLKALLAEILTGESLKEIKVEVSLERMDALMKELL